MRIEKQKLIDEFNLKPFGAKGWMRADDLKCPVCNRSEKFGILFTEKGGVSHCFFECGDNLSLVKYLKHINREEFIIYEQEFSINDKLKPLFGDNKEELKELQEIDLPKGFKRIYSDEYLTERNFTDWQYELFEVGVTDHFLERKLKNYLIFCIKQEGKIVAWLARSKRDKEWHKENLKKSKEGLEKLVLRYKNSPGADFDRIIGGYDQITENTHTVFIVEGIFDMTNLSNLLKTYESEEVKVIFTFGNSMSDHQIALLLNKKVKRIILMYDYGTVRQLKELSLKLSRWYEVDICDIEFEDIDPGNIDKKYLNKLLLNLKNYIYFYSSKLNNLKL